MDTSVLQTLPDREWTSGLAEVVKYAFIEDAEFFQYLEQNGTAVLNREARTVDHIVRRSAEIKAEIVSEDERESGHRAVLNFGHTFAHAIEKTAGYGRFTHGEAVALGMMAALHLSHQFHPEIPLERGIDLIRRIPIRDSPASYPVETLMQAMQSDKKRKRGQLHYVLLDRIGHAYVTNRPTSEQVEAAWLYIQNGSF
jgi:3-dehydroquinate synthase